mmetsp:Transcript_5357/g.13764  ORF Transcript_5357/g.13764 Transcript_5357/m.13764 type:complete len:229 (-) Transcript_5357:119-805(-)
MNSVICFELATNSETFGSPNRSHFLEELGIVHDWPGFSRPPPPSSPIRASRSGRQVSRHCGALICEIVCALVERVATVALDVLESDGSVLLHLVKQTPAGADQLSVLCAIVDARGRQRRVLGVAADDQVALTLFENGVGGKLVQHLPDCRELSGVVGRAVCTDVARATALGDHWAACLVAHNATSRHNVTPARGRSTLLHVVVAVARAISVDIERAAARAAGIGLLGR